MIKLVLDTSNRYLYYAIIKDQTILIEKKQVGNNNHSEKLIDSLKQGFEEINLTTDDIDEIYVGKGPGSYTGIRVACTVAKVLAFVKKIPLFAFSSLDLLVSTVLKQDGLYVAHIDARREHCFAKVIEVENGEIKVIANDQYVENQELNVKYPNATFLNSDSEYDILQLLEAKTYESITNLHSFVPTYLRSGIQ